MAPQITLEEASVAASLTILEEQGFGLDLVLACLDEDIDRLAPDVLTPLQALKLKIAVRKKRAEQYDESLYHRLLCFVGRVEVLFDDETMQVGNCVLIREQGFAITALHILTRDDSEEDEKADSNKAKKKAASSSPCNRKRTRVQVQEINLTFPNTSEGLLLYKAVLVHHSAKDDLALLRAEDPLPSRFQTIHTVRSWPSYHPQEQDRVFLLSFPAGKGEQECVSHNPSGDKDFPCYADGVVTCVAATKGLAFADYTAFGGASGALLVHSLPDMEGYRATIHLGTYHESVELPTWNRPQLDKLNDSLGQKARNGYFSLNVGAFIDSYFRPGGAVGKVLRHKYLHPQVVVRRKETRKGNKDEAVEELDLFGKWPGLDDSP